MQERKKKNMRTLEELLKTNKRTGEILKSFKPHYRGRELSDVYGRYSIAKQNGYDYCLRLLESFNPDYVYSYGITSANTFKFTFAAVFEKKGFKYVLWCTSSRDEVYALKF